MHEKTLDWIKKATDLAEAFSKEHKLTLSVTDRQIFAAFEIGCFHALINFYNNQGYTAIPKSLTANNEFRYLTTPSGNPENFSYVTLIGKDGEFEIRQQVRVRSHLDANIAFTPDIVVLLANSGIEKQKIMDFANGKRPFYCIDAGVVVAAHECKSMNPFPELLVSFIGMLVAAHSWYPDGEQVNHTTRKGHLAPTLFVGGSASVRHIEMVKAMSKAFMLNIVCGLHEGTWSLNSVTNKLIVSTKFRQKTKFTTPIADTDLPF